MESSNFFFVFFFTLISSTLSSTVVEDLANLQPPPDFNTTITTNCLQNPSLRYCNSSSFNIIEIFRFTIVASHLCNESKNPNCVESFPKIRIHSRPKTAALYLSFDFFWKYCPLTIIDIKLVNNSLTNGFPVNLLSCNQIHSLDLSFNQFTGDLPVQNLSNLPNLTHLNISYNRFSEDKVSDSEFFKRFNASSFVNSGVLPNLKGYKIKVLVLLIGFPLMVLMLFCFLGWLCVNRPDYLPKTLQRSNNFTPAILDAATDEFSAKNLMGNDNGIEIYKGRLRDGKEIKIEIYKEKISKAKRREFKEECKVIVQLRHKNLVKVLGWCNERRLRALITQWINGESVENWLMNSSSSASFRRRLRIVMGVLEGVCDLSEQWPEVSYDLTTNSLLLNENQEPLISRFKVVEKNNLTSSIVDFGMFVLEMMTNLRPDRDQGGDVEKRYVEYIRVHYPDNLERVIDEKMKINEEKKMFEKCKELITLGLMCTDKPPLKQPSLNQIYDLVASLCESCSRHH